MVQDTGFNQPKQPLVSRWKMPPGCIVKGPTRYPFHSLVFASLAVADPSLAQTYEARGPLTVQPIPSGYQEVLPADFNGDGKPEYLARLGGFSGGGVDLVIDTGSGLAATLIPDLFFGSPLPVVSDFDGDGFDDYASVAVSGNRRLYPTIFTSCRRRRPP